MREALDCLTARVERIENRRRFVELDSPESSAVSSKLADARRALEEWERAPREDKRALKRRFYAEIRALVRLLDEQGWK